MKYANGDVYIGDFKNDLIKGKGECKYANGAVYIGEYKNDKKEGKG